MLARKSPLPSNKEKSQSAVKEMGDLLTPSQCIYNMVITAFCKSFYRHSLLLLLIPVGMYIIYTQYYKIYLPSKITSTRPFNKSHMNILCFGDSLTAGRTGRYVDGKLIYHPYSRSLEKLLNKKGLSKDFSGIFMVDNQGVNGEEVQKSMEQRLPKILKEGYYDWVVILGGSNDLRVVLESSSGTQANDEKSYQAIFDALRNLYHIVHQHGGRTVAVTIPGRLCERTSRCLKIRTMRLRINELIRKLAEESQNDIVLADLDRYIPMMTNSYEYWGDEVHFNPKGYDKMGVLIYTSLRVAYEQH